MADSNYHGLCLACLNVNQFWEGNFHGHFGITPRAISIVAILFDDPVKKAAALGALNYWGSWH